MEPRAMEQRSDREKKRRRNLSGLVLILTFALGIAVGISLAKAFIEVSAILGAAIVIVIIVAVLYFVLRRRREHRAA